MPGNFFSHLASKYLETLTKKISVWRQKCEKKWGKMSLFTFYSRTKQPDFHKTFQHIEILDLLVMSHCFFQWVLHVLVAKWRVLLPFFWFWRKLNHFLSVPVLLDILKSRTSCISRLLFIVESPILWFWMIPWMIHLVWNFLTCLLNPQQRCWRWVHEQVRHTYIFLAFWWW